MDESDVTRIGCVTQRRDGTATSNVSLTSRFPGHQRAIIRRQHGRREHGVAMMWVAVILLLIILIVGLGLDSAKGFLVAHQLQNAADAAALAGARVVKLDPNNARNTAIAVALLNFADGNAVELADNAGNLPNGDVVVGRYDRSIGEFTPTLDGVNAIKVVARRTDTSLGGPVPLNFGPIAGIDTVNIERHAIGMTSGGTGAGLIALRPDGIGLLLNGGAIIDVNDGAVQVNSADDNATRLIGTVELNADELNIWGDISATGGIDLDEYPFPINTSAPPIPDPLCPDPPTTCIPPPTWDPSADLGGGDTVTIEGGTHVFSPGFYSGGFRITGGDITFQPGVYILDGHSTGLKSGLVVAGNANLCAKGVMFYITGDGVLDLAGTGDIRVTPPDINDSDFCDPGFTYPSDLEFEYYEGISIFQDRLNDNDARIVGTNLMDLDGTLYFPQNHLDLAGTGDGFGNQLIAWSIEISGTADIVINYDGRNKAPGNKSYLVE